MVQLDRPLSAWVAHAGRQVSDVRLGTAGDAERDGLLPVTNESAPFDDRVPSYGQIAGKYTGWLSRLLFRRSKEETGEVEKEAQLVSSTAAAAATAAHDALVAEGQATELNDRVAAREALRASDPESKQLKELLATYPSLDSDADEARKGVISAQEQSDVATRAAEKARAEHTINGIVYAMQADMKAEKNRVPDVHKSDAGAALRSVQEKKAVLKDGATPDILKAVEEAETLARDFRRLLIDEGDPALDTLREDINRLCVSSATNYEQAVAPPASNAARAHRQNATTVEVVKKDGAYSVVIDGIANNAPSGGVFFLPRFQETVLAEGGGTRRAVQPVLISVRAEDFERMPASCALSAHQTIRHGRTVVADQEEVFLKALRPLSAGDDSQSVHVVPYPVVATPEPHFCVNDYSQTRRAEVLYQVASGKGVYGILRSLSARNKRAFVGTLLSASMGTGLAIASLALVLTGNASIVGAISNVAVPGTGDMAQATFNFLVKATLALSVPIGAAVVTDKVIGEQLQVWLMGASAKVTKEDMGRLLKAHSRLGSVRPPRHRIGITELPSVLRCISYRRYTSRQDALAQSTGLTATDLSNTDLKRETALLSYLAMHDRRRDGKAIYQSRAAMAREYAWQAAPPAKTMTQILLAGSGVATAFSDPIAQVVAGIFSIAPLLPPAMLAVAGIGSLAGVTYLRRMVSNKPVASQVALASYASRQDAREKGPDPRNGLYTEAQNAVQSHDLEIHTTACPLTQNTIDYEGMCPAALCETRSELEYRITIKEHGVDKPVVVVLKPTLSNGVDAGWIGAGYDDVLRRCNEEASCLELKLMAMPSVATSVLKHMTLVVDSVGMRSFARKGYIDGVLAAERDALTANSAPTATVSQKVADAIVRRQAARIRVAKLETDVKAAERKADASVSQAELLSAMQELDTARRHAAAADAVATAMQAEAFDDQATPSLFQRAALQARQGGALIDYVGFMMRLRETIIGGQGERMWEMDGWHDGDVVPADLGGTHEEACRASLYASLSLSQATGDAARTRVWRHMRIYSPYSNSKPKMLEAMRVAAFSVPEYLDVAAPGEWVVRVVPHIMEPDGGEVARIPASATRPTELLARIDSHRSVASAVACMSRALDGSRLLYEVNDLPIWAGQPHFTQVYTPASASDLALRPQGRVSREPPPDLLATAALLSKSARQAAKAANDAGGRTLLRLLEAAAGSSHGGVASVLQEVGCPRGQGGLLALAAFAEMYATQESRLGLPAEPGLRVRDLVSHPIKAACESAARSAAFIKGRKWRATLVSEYRLMWEDDLAFACLPRMRHVKIAMRHAGLLSRTLPSGSVAASLDVIDDYTEALARLAKASSLRPERLPFTCAQSVVGRVPLVAREFGEGDDALLAQLRALVGSYTRLWHLMPQSGRGSARRGEVLAGCINSRPVVIRAAKEASDLLQQTLRALKVEAPMPRAVAVFSAAGLRHRLARLRLLRDIPPDVVGRDGWHAKLVGNATRTIQGGLVGGTGSSATFFVPFGTFDVGGVSDVAHLNFEMRPVWTAALVRAASALLDDASGAYPESATLVLRDGWVDDQHRPMHPYVIDVQVDPPSISVGYDATPPPGDQPPAVDGDRTAIDSLCSDIRSRPRCTGRWTEAYRAAIYNAERIFQGNLVAASEMCVPLVDGAEPVLQIFPRLEQDTSVAVAATVANALAAVSVDRPVRAVINAPRDTVVQALRRVKDACQRLSVVAHVVPVAELCAALG